MKPTTTNMNEDLRQEPEQEDIVEPSQQSQPEQQQHEPPQTQEFFELDYQDIKIRCGSNRHDIFQIANLLLQVIDALKSKSNGGNKPGYI